MADSNSSSLQFPADFVWGTATASYQIEGGVKEDGRGESIWDRFSHTPGKILDNSSGDIACDHYHLWREDLRAIRALNVNAYRFSISWPRVLPAGLGQVNEAGLDFYEQLVDGLLEAGVQPFVTLFHWDLPQALQDRGGFAVRDSAEWFAEYTERVVSRLSDRVKHWITLNEPFVVYALGYFLGEHAPGQRNFRRALKVAHNLLRAHGRGVQVIRALDLTAQLGITNALQPVHAVHPRRDARARRRAEGLTQRLMMDPIFRGRYPDSVRRLVHVVNRQIRPEDFELISQPIDFLGVNNYSRMVVQRTLNPIPGFRLVQPDYPGIQFTEMGWEVYPEGLRELLVWIRDEYGNIPVYITENGAAFADSPPESAADPSADGSSIVDTTVGVHDVERRRFLRDYLAAVARAHAEGCNVRGYFVWTLLDNFEWAFGYTKRFGLYYTDYQSRRRTLKASGAWYAELARTGRIPRASVVGPRRD
ncbi:MAG: beta-glucosidase [Spirochaetes bacterium]|jgi:beta-glucosidase|nr:beta-glucosidase [Spirochaetota bacterium]